MKILQVNCVYQKGSTGKIVHDVHKGLLEREMQSVVCYGRGAKIDEANVYKTCGELYSKANNLLSRITGLMYGGCLFSTNKLISVIKKENPDIVHLHCINGHFVNIYRLIEWLKKSKIKTMLTLHAEFMHTANCGHAFECKKWKNGCGKCPRLKRETQSWFFDRTHDSWEKMKKAFDGFENLTVTSVSPWLMDRAKQSPILADKKHCVVLNGLDTETFKRYDTAELRKKHGLTDEKIIFHASPSFNNDPNHIKGGYYVLSLAEKMRGENVKFLVAGQYPSDLKVPSNVILLRAVSDQKLLAQYYAMADLTVLASKKETFSMICAESLCCGTPIVGFEAGAPETISLPEYSEFVEYGNVDLLKNSVEKWLAKSDFDKEKISELAKKRYSAEKMTEGYIEVYKSFNE